MKTVIIICLFAISMAKVIPFNAEYDKHWETFKFKFNKNYEENEEIERRLIWEENVNAIVKHNLNHDLGLYSYSLGVNEYSDMTHEEFIQTMNGLKRMHNSTKYTYNFTKLSNVILPDSVDWRKEGYVTEVKNQKLCGSCWAFSTTGALEGQHKKKTGKLVSLSEQNLVDCSTDNFGCRGGYPYLGFIYVEENNGIDTEHSYPYEAIDGKCRFKRKFIGATCSGLVKIQSGSEEALKQAVATIGPISIAIDASSKEFYAYKKGIFDYEWCSSTYLDHAVLLVGYGTENGVDYWLVKNSYGASWGDNGYIKMSRNKNNQCGIATLASYPLM